MHNFQCEIDLINFKINNQNNLIKKYKKENIEFYVYGILVGGYLNEKKYNSDEILQLLITQAHNKKNLNEIMRCIVGPCYIISIINNILNIYSSSSSSGFLFLKKSNKIYISNLEGNFYRTAKKKYNLDSLNEEAVFNLLNSHHSLMRAPMSGLIQNTFRCPPGFNIIFSGNEFKFKSFLLLDKNYLINKKDDYKKLNDSFKAVSNLYKEYCVSNNIKIKILMSGGIDSSLLLSYFKKDFNFISLSYHNYNKKLENIFANNMAKHFNLKLNEIKKDEINDKVINKYAKEGLGMLISPSHFNYIYSNNERVEFKIRGQNGDTLFHVDHFGPNNRVGGVARILNSIFTLKKRIFHYMNFFEKKKYLKIWPFSINEKKSHFEFKDLVYNSLFSLDEHSVPFEKINSHNSIINNFREKNYWLPIQKVFTDKYGDGWEKNENPYLTNHLNRMVRWIRTITNFSQQFSNRSFYENSISITPYCEGPITNILLSWQLNYRDFFVIKRFSLKYFYYNTGKKYSTIRRESIGIFNLAKQLISFFVINQRKKNNVIDKKDFNILRQLYLKNLDKNFKINSNFKNREISININKLYDAAFDYKLCKKNKIRTSELCNLLNLHILLRDVFAER